LYKRAYSATGDEEDPEGDEADKWNSKEQKGCSEEVKQIPSKDALKN
jgi:hypothetical protein